MHVLVFLPSLPGRVRVRGRQGYDSDAPAFRRKLRSRANQMLRAVSAVHLAVDGLPSRDRLIVLNEALRDALDDDERERDDA